MIKRTIILATAAVCLAAAIILLANFTYRRAAEPAWISDRFCRAESVFALREPTYEHMRERIKQYERYIGRFKKSGALPKPPLLRPEKPLIGKG